MPGACVHAAPALARIGDVRAVPALCRILEQPPWTWPYGLGEAVEAIAAPGHSPLLDALLSASARHPERCGPGRICPALLTAVGVAGFGAAATPAVPSLVALLRQAIARLVLPALDAIIGRRERLPVHLGDPGAELRADERLLTRTREARELIGS